MVYYRSFPAQAAAFPRLAERSSRLFQGRSQRQTMKPEKLQEFRRQLLALRSRLAYEVNQLIDSMPHEGQPSGEISHIPTHNADRDSDGVDKEVALVQNEEGLLEAVSAAIERIDQGTFGTCEGCRGKIALVRLEAIPYTPLCIDCAQRSA